jgi:sugar lactone lactonase YvrE
VRNSFSLFLGQEQQSLGVQNQKKEEIMGNTLVQLLIVIMLCSLVLALPAAAAETYNVVTTWGTLGTGNGQFISPEGIAVDSSGNVYVADTGNGRIQKFTSDGLYLTQWGSLGTGDGQFTNPHGIAADSSGNVYVAEPEIARIQRFTSGGTFLTKWGYIANPSEPYYWMQGPAGVAVDSSGYVYSAQDYDSPRVMKFTSNGTFVDDWNTPGLLTRPRGVAVGSSGYVYVVSNMDNPIQKFASDGTYVMGWGTPLGTGDGEFDSPQGITVDSFENVYVADTKNNRIQKFTSDGTYLTQWGSLGTGDGEFNSSEGIAVDNFGAVYVADTENNRIQKFMSEDTGNLEVKSSPSHAKIYVNSIDTGKFAKWTFDDLAPGDYEVSVDLEGYNPQTETITIVSEQTVKLHFKLDKVKKVK